MSAEGQQATGRNPLITVRMHLTFFVALTRWERIKLRFTWGYIRQTRLLLPITTWWLNRG